TGSSYKPDLTADFENGCLIYGIAEYDRAGGPVEGIRRLLQLPDLNCRRQALSGLGWGMGERFLRSGDVDELGASLAAVEDLDLRFHACGGVIFVLSHPKPLAETRSFPVKLLTLCKRS